MGTPTHPQINDQNSPSTSRLTVKGPCWRLALVSAGLCATLVWAWSAQAAPWGPGIEALATAVAEPVASPGPTIAVPLRHMEVGDLPCESSATACLAQVDTAGQGVAPDLQDYRYFSAVTGLSGGGSLGRPILALGWNGALPEPVTSPTWFGGVGTTTGGQLAGNQWHYDETGRQVLAVGQFAAQAPQWGDAPQMGGVQVGSWGSTTSALSPGQFGYASTVGWIDPDATLASVGSADDSQAAGLLSMRYGLAPNLTLESQMQTADAFSAAGMGAMYSAGQIGTLYAGALQSHRDNDDGYRVQAGYQVKVTPGLTLGYSNAYSDAGFNDLSNYADGVQTSDERVNTLSAGVDLGRLGTLTGSFSGLSAEGDASDDSRYYGLTQTVSLNDSTTLSLSANREVVSGDYQMLLTATMPLAVLMRRLTDPW